MSTNRVSFKLNITLTPPQAEIDRHSARFKVIKAGRRFGKTRLAAKWLATRALTVKGKHWYVSPTLGLAKDEMFPALIDVLPPSAIVKIDERHLVLTVSNGVFNSVIMCKTAEKETNLRGRGLASLVIDEAAFLRPTLWPEVLRPQLMDAQGHALIISTPKKGWFTRLYKDAAACIDPDLAGFHYTIYDSWLANTNPGAFEKEVNLIRRTVPEHVWLQEYMAEEIALAGQVYEEFDPANHVYNPANRFTDYRNWPAVCGMDWGTHAETAAVWVAVNPHGHLVAVREHVKGGWDVAKHAEAMQRMGAGMHVAPFDYVLDRSAFRKEGTSGLSIAQQFKDRDIHASPSERDVNATTDLVKRCLRGAQRVPWLFVSVECQRLISAISEWEYGQHEPDVLAAFRYGVAHAIRRRHTTLLDLPPEVEPEEARAMAELHVARGIYKIPLPAPKPNEWTWDHEAGVP